METFCIIAALNRDIEHSFVISVRFYVKFSWIAEVCNHRKLLNYNLELNQDLVQQKSPCLFLVETQI